MRKFLFAIFAIVLLTACNQEELGRIDVKGDTEFNVGFAGGNVMLNIETGGNWSIKEDYTWCHASPSEGERGIYTVHFSVDENQSSEDRTASFTISSSKKTVSILVKQEHKPDFSVNNLPEKLPYERGSYAFQVITEGEIQASVEEGREWLTCEPAGTKADLNVFHFTLYVTDNQTNSERVARIVFHNLQNGIIARIEVTQEGEPEGFITFADEIVELVCLDKFDTNKDGKLSYAEAKRVESLSANFFGDSYRGVVTSFDELQYFTGLTDIYTQAFYNSSLQSVILPKNVTQIRSEAFSVCHQLKKVVLPEGLTNIGRMAFAYDDKLEEINFPSNLQKIGEMAFQGAGIKAISISKGLQTIGYGAFEMCDALKTVDAGPDLVTLEDAAFHSCSSLEEVKFPGTLTSFGFAVFGRCPNLRSIQSPFSTDDGRCVIKGGELLAFAPAGITDFTIPESVRAITKQVFVGNASLKSVTIPSTVVSIGESAFSECTSLESIALHKNIKSMGSFAFSGCTSLKNVDFQAEVTRLDDTFYNCKALESISLPETVTNLYGYVFGGCSNLKDVHLNEGITYMSDWIFSDCTSLNSIVLPSTVTSMGQIFTRCNHLYYVTVKATTPPGIYSDFLRGCPIEKIYVPAGAVEAYKSADYWSAFSSIIEAIQ